MRYQTNGLGCDPGFAPVVYENGAETCEPDPNSPEYQNAQAAVDWLNQKASGGSQSATKSGGSSGGGVTTGGRVTPLYQETWVSKNKSFLIGAAVIVGAVVVLKYMGK